MLLIIYTRSNTMKPKILTALKISLLAIAASSLSACFSHSYYGPPA